MVPKICPAFTLSLTFLGACGGGSVFVSSPISLEIGGIKESEIRSGAYSHDKHVDGEPGKPYDTFLSQTRVELEGRDPSAITVDKILLNLGGDSKGVGSGGFSEVFMTLEVFLTDGTTTVAIGSLAEVDPGTSMEVAPIAGEEELAPLHPKMLKREFSVGIRGSAVAALPAEFEVKTNAQLTFRAYD